MELTCVVLVELSSMLSAHCKLGRWKRVTDINIGERFRWTKIAAEADNLTTVMIIAKHNVSRAPSILIYTHAKVFSGTAFENISSRNGIYDITVLCMTALRKGRHWLLFRTEENDWTVLQLLFNLFARGGHWRGGLWNLCKNPSYESSSFRDNRNIHFTNNGTIVAFKSAVMSFLRSFIRGTRSFLFTSFGSTLTDSARDIPKERYSSTAISKLSK